MMTFTVNIDMEPALQSPYHLKQFGHLKDHEVLDIDPGPLQLYSKLVGALALIYIVFLVVCTVGDFIKLEDALVATVITILFWSLVTAVSLKIKFDCTSPAFVHDSLLPIFLFILYLLLWQCFCKCCHHSTTNTAIVNAELQFNWLTISLLEIVLVLGLIATISQWHHGRSLHLSSCPYSGALLFFPLVLLYGLVLNQVLFFRRTSWRQFL